MTNGLKNLTEEEIASAQAWAVKVSKASGSQYTPASKNAAAYILSHVTPKPERIAAQWENMYGWKATPHPIAEQAFAWADSTGVRRGSGAYGYFVEAYVSGYEAALCATPPQTLTPEKPLINILQGEDR